MAKKPQDKIEGKDDIPSSETRLNLKKEDLDSVFNLMDEGDKIRENGAGDKIVWKTIWYPMPFQFYLSKGQESQHKLEGAIAAYFKQAQILNDLLKSPAIAKFLPLVWSQRIQPPRIPSVD